MHRFLRSPFFRVLLFTVLPLVSQAATITFYNMRSNWEGAVGFFHEEDFDDGLVNSPGLSVVSTVGTTSFGIWSDQVDDSVPQTTEWSFASDLEETTIYLHVSTRQLHATPSPLDALALTRYDTQDDPPQGT